MANVLVIAEIGINHNGEIDVAKKLVDAAVGAGANVVKFQTFRTNDLVTDEAPAASYQKQNMPRVITQKEILSKVELSYSEHEELSLYANSVGIDYMSTAFDVQSLQFIDKSICPTALKISSGDLTNGPFLLEHARTNRRIILSTGMADIQEIDQALSVLAYGYLTKETPKNMEEINALYKTDSGQAILKKNVCLLHCVTEYPAPVSEVNLLAIQTMSRNFGLSVGYSDHTQGIWAAPVAVALGADVIEKHITLDRLGDGPDHLASLEPDEFSQMINSIRLVETMLGDGTKRPQNSELKNRDIARRSLMARQGIACGEEFSSANIVIKRPGKGRSPMDYWDLLGQVSETNISANDLIP